MGFILIALAALLSNASSGTQVSSANAAATLSVDYEIKINATGRVVACWIVKSSGNSALDRETCTLLTRRARYEPVATTQRGSMVWKNGPGGVLTPLPSVR